MVVLYGKLAIRTSRARSGRASRIVQFKKVRNPLYRCHSASIRAD